MASPRLVYLNGSFVLEEQAVISVFDRGFRWGDAVYEMTRTFAWKPFKLREHLDRLKWSLHYTRIDPGMSMDELEEATLELLHVNSPSDKREDVGITHIVSRGLVEPTRQVKTKPNVVIYLEPLAFGLYAQFYTQGIRLITPATRRTPPQSLSPKAKISNKMNHNVATFEAQAVDSEALPLMLDYDGNVTESSGSNFLFKRQNTMYVPNRCHVLGGISMETVLELAQGMGMKVEEGDYTPFDVYKAEEAFLTSTPWNMAPVVSLNGLKISDGQPGPVFHQIMQAWSERVEVDLIDQAISHLSTEARRALTATGH